MNIQDQKLLSCAKEMRQKARASYSKFRVGAALQTITGDIIGGCNIESVSYGLTICAERVAIFQAIAGGHKEFKSLLILTDNGSYPCGACRQIISEFCPGCLIIIATEEKIITTSYIQELLPNAFACLDE